MCPSGFLSRLTLPFHGKNGSKGRKSTKAGGRSMSVAPGKKRTVTRMLERAPAPVFVAYSIVAAFTTYFCMYAFRKPFAAAKFDNEVFWFFGSSIGLKTALVISQIIGYAI